jgi:hypothetical protein
LWFSFFRFSGQWRDANSSNRKGRAWQETFPYGKGWLVHQPTQVAVVDFPVLVGIQRTCT